MPPSENTPEKIRLFLAEFAGIDPEELKEDVPLRDQVDLDGRICAVNGLEARLGIHLSDDCGESFRDCEVTPRGLIHAVMAEQGRKAA